MNADGQVQDKNDLRTRDMSSIRHGPHGQFAGIQLAPSQGITFSSDGNRLAPISGLTRDVGRNERPQLGPDGRHLVFESTAPARGQICLCFADGTMGRQLTMPGQNESPNWSPK